MALARALLLLGLAAAAAAAAAPLELYFSPAELVRIAGYGEDQLSSVLISGEVACDVCFRPGSDLLTFDVPGAKVAVACDSEDADSMAESAFATTDEYGKFTLDLPSRLHATPSLEKACTVKLLRVPPDSLCRGVLHRSKSYAIKPSSSSHSGVRAYTTGAIRLDHSTIPSDQCVRMESRSDGQDA